MWQHLAVAIRERVLPGVRLAGGDPYALFAPQFGLASNQLVMMTAWPSDIESVPVIVDLLAAIDEVGHVEHHGIAATARPLAATPPERGGVYVHRFFDLDTARVAEVVELSSTAWDTFEDTFDVEVIGFFLTDRAAGEPAELMLLNRYPSLASWEASRHFDLDPESRARFERRAGLTTRTRAITTTLLSG